MKLSLIVLVLLNILLLPVGLNLPQENPEELFLSDQSLKELNIMKKDFGDQDLVFVSKVPKDNIFDITTEIMDRGGEFSSLSPLLEGHGVMRLPPLGDRDKFDFFKSLTKKFPYLTFAGEAYTNAHLAGMSLKIQQVLFPAVFAVILVGILLLTRSLPVSAYLFLSSLLGTGEGLAFTRLLYGHSTILMTLTPLIAFILTLGCQLHVVYGLARYKDPKELYELKIRPILMMMITTIMGFLGLLTSDLPSIRQLAMSTSLTLTVTWAILLIMVKIKPPQINLPLPRWLDRQWSPPGYSPIWGNAILAFLLIFGTIGLMRMPTLVEAIHFFPNGHEVQTGYGDILKGLGGTPQYDVFIKRKDGQPLVYEDHVKLHEYGKKLQSELPHGKILSLTELVAFANEKYTGNNTLPDNDPAFGLLAGRIPGPLYEHLTTSNVTRLSLVTELPSTDERTRTTAKLETLLKGIDPFYEAKLGGLTHLLLESQLGLVRSLIKSFLTSFLMITLVFAFFSKDLKATSIFGFLNFASVMGGIMLMWMLGFTLNVSSVMTVSISMGLVVDSTIHLLHGQRMKESKEAIYQTTLIPIVFSHILLFVAFAGLSLESFIPIRDFSLGLIMLLFVGLLCDLLVLPMVAKDE